MDGITWERLPAERDARINDPAAAGGCCCCCCCCLHTVGGLIAAATTRAPKHDLDAPIAVVGGAEARPRYSITGLYWRTLLVVALVSGPLFFFGIHERLNAVSWFWYLAMLLPAIQLGTSVVLALWMMATSKQRVGYGVRMRHLGRITLRGFVGGLIGVGVMALIGLSL